MPTLFLTGSSGALAQSIRSGFLEAGWSVAGFDRTDDRFAATNYRFYQSNAMDEESVHSGFTLAMNELGSPQSLVATVGGIKPWMPITEVSIEDFRFLLELNLVSFFIAAKQAMLLMKPQTSGSIISIGAEPALHPTKNKSGYIAAKSGVMALTQVIAEEGKSVGVTANSIVPTIIRTKANMEWGSPEDIPKWTPPEDIAAMCLFLSSERGRSITGARIEMPNKV